MTRGCDSGPEMPAITGNLALPRHCRGSHTRPGWLGQLGDPLLSLRLLGEGAQSRDELHVLTFLALESVGSTHTDTLGAPVDGEATRYPGVVLLMR
jgi:hypothetical protein